MINLDYKLLRERRTTLSVEVDEPTGEVLVHAPKDMPLREIEHYLSQIMDWITVERARQRERRQQGSRPAAPTGSSRRQDPVGDPRWAATGIPYKLIRSGRKTLGIEISRQGELVARAPWDMPLGEIEGCLVKEQDWIVRSIKETLDWAAAHPKEPEPEPPKGEFEGIPYTLVRSGRKSIAVEITLEAQVVVRAPEHATQKEIETFLQSRKDWIETHLAGMQERVARHPEPDEKRWEELTRAAQEYLPRRMEHFARIMHVCPRDMRLSRAKTRFGSCSADNVIMFSVRLMDYPQAAVDYVIVHELAHILYKNHGKEFYRLVASVLPDYKERAKLLKQ